MEFDDTKASSSGHDVEDGDTLGPVAGNEKRRGRFAIFYIVVFRRGMDRVETFLNIAGSFVYPVTIGLVVVLWRRLEGQLLPAARKIFPALKETGSANLTGSPRLVARWRPSSLL